jgi:hypothetical protein
MRGEDLCVPAIGTHRSGVTEGCSWTLEIAVIFSPLKGVQSDEPYMCGCGSLGSTGSIVTEMRAPRLKAGLGVSLRTVNGLEHGAQQITRDDPPGAER